MATPASLRVLFPEITEALYPDPRVQMRIDIASKLVNADRWGDLTDHGISLHAAHFLLVYGPQSGPQVGRTAAGGLVTSKSADGLSLSLDVSTVSEEGAGMFNSTAYGREYYRLARMMGAGPIQIGVPTASDLSPTPWPGVVYTP